jgi:hypothetical protein
MRGKADMNGVQEGGKFERIPDGDYYSRITEVKDKVTANGDPMASITLTITEGKFEGRKMWDNIIFPHSESPAIKILGRSKHFLHAIGEPYEGAIEYDTDNWKFKDVIINVGFEPAKGEYKEKNVVKDYIIPEQQSAPAIKKSDDIAWDE